MKKKKIKENMAEEPFDGCIKCHSNDRAEQPKISMLTTEILCKNKQNKTKIFSLLLCSIFVREPLYCIIRADL